MSGIKKGVGVVSILFMGGLFVFVDFLAFLVAGPFDDVGAVAFENPGDPLNLLFFVVVLLVFTAVILLIIRFRKKQALRSIFLGAATLLIFYVLYPVLFIFVANDVLALGLSMLGAAFLLVLLVKKPEWYVIDAVALLIGVGAVAMIGISLDVWIVIVLLMVMAVYDALSVYRTKHMIDLADSVMGLNLPVMFVVPKRRGYSLLEKRKGLKEKLESGEEREAYFLGVGDVVFPGILAVAAFHSLAVNGLIMAVSVLAGTLLGFVVLTAYVIKGKPQAGLPFLCSGAILAYMVAGFLLFGIPPL
jgi:presenilin-like A22 family membrane protease